ncbi:MAG: Fic family protein [Acidobacteriota bacterium]
MPFGRFIRCPEGYTAFVPAALPPKIEWTSNLVRDLSDADRAIGRLAGEGAGLPNPHLLIRPFIRREAVLSSKIEGTQATLGELLASEAGADVERSPADLREVANYVSALEFGVRRLEKLPLSLRLIRELHEKLMTGVRGDAATPGEFRRSQNWIGRPGSTLANATYVPPPVKEMNEGLGRFEKFLHERTLPPLVHAGMAHAHFEAIHPFLDGNGRVGRLLITLLLVERRVLPTPLLYLSAYFEATQSEYYDRLLHVNTKGEWQEWLAYFLKGVARQSDDAIDRVTRMNRILADWRKKASGSGGKAASALVELLAGNPFWTVKRAAAKLKVAYTTAERALEKLEVLGVVQRISDAKRGRVYCATKLLHILEEPARLAPEKRS